MTAAYVPARDPVSKVRRRFTQWRASRPARLAFDQPLLSISFDDFPCSAAETGAAILEAHGARGTFYAAAGLANTDGPSGRNFAPAQVARLAASGHEIGCHSFGHADAAQHNVFDTLKDLAKNRDALAAFGARPARTHAYPFGETTNRLKDGLPPRFACARGILPGLNVGAADLAQLHAYPLFGDDWLRGMQSTLKRAAKRKAWVIGFTHDVSDAPSAWGTRAEDLDALLRTAHALGFTVLPVTAALERRLP